MEGEKMPASDDMTEEMNKQIAKDKKRQELKEQLGKSKKLNGDDSEKLKSM